MKRILFPYSDTSVGGSVISPSLVIKELLNSKIYIPEVVVPKNGPNAEVFRNIGLQPQFYCVNEQKADKFITLSSINGLINNIKVLGIYFEEYRYAFKYLKFHRPDLVHINDDTTMLTWAPAAKKLDIPVIWHIRQQKGNKITDRFRMKFVDYIIFVSSNNRVRFRSFKNIVPNKVIYNGVDLDMYYPPIDKEYSKRYIGLNEHYITIGFVGNLISRKRPEWFIEAALEVCKTNNKVQFVVVGKDRTKGRYTKLLKDKVRNTGFEDNFYFLGYRGDTADIIRALDILVLTSVSDGEAFPRVILESMATSVPVISTNIAGVPEAIAHYESGFLVDENNIKDLFNKLLYLVNNVDERLRLSKNAYRKVLRCFSHQKTNKEIFNLYNCIIGEQDDQN